MQGKIYGIFAPHDEKVYIGSTSRPYLSSRSCCHKASYRDKKGYLSSHRLFDEYGVDNCTVRLIEAYECETKVDLRKRERYWMEHPDYKDKIVNEQRAFLSKEEMYQKINEHTKRWSKVRIIAPCCGKEICQGYRLRHTQTCKKSPSISNDCANSH